MNNTYDRGSLRITKQTLQISNTTINLSRIEKLKVFDYKKHSYFNGVKTWLIGLVIIVVVCAFVKKLMWVGDIYIFTIIPLLIYNFYEHKKSFFGLRIDIGSELIYFKSDSKEFINDLRDVIVNAMDNRNANYTINFDSHDIVNNGVISKGDNNTNKVVNKTTKKVNKKNDK